MEVQSELKRPLIQKESAPSAPPMEEEPTVEERVREKIEEVKEKVQQVIPQGLTKIPDEIPPDLQERLLENLDYIEQQIDQVNPPPQFQRMKTRLKHAKLPMKFSLHSLIIALNGSYLFFTSISIAIITIFDPIISFFMSMFFYIGIAAAGVYIILFLMVWKLKKHIKERSIVFFMIILQFACEIIILSYMAIAWEPIFMLAEVNMCCLGLYLTAFFAAGMRSRYRAESGRLIAMLGTVIVYLFYSIVLDKFLMIPVVSFIQALCAIVVAVYQWLLVSKVDHIVFKLGGEETLRAGVWGALLLVKYKIKWLFFIFVYLFSLCKRKNVDGTDDVTIPKTEHEA